MTEEQRKERGERVVGRGAIAGEWVTPGVNYVDPARRFCALCGRPIARRYWRVELGGEELTFCEPGHAALYTTYPNRTTNPDQH